jgi:hypothetical protein
MPRKQLASTITRMNPAATHADLGGLLEEMVEKINQLAESVNDHLGEATVHNVATTASSVATMQTIAQREFYP